MEQLPSVAKSRSTGTDLAPSLRRWALLVPVVFVVFYVGLHFWGVHSEGYAFLTRTITHSATIQQRVGDVQSTRLSLLGGYSEKFVGSNKNTTMTIDVVGQRGTVAVKASAEKINGLWRVSEASINGECVTLN